MADLEPGTRLGVYRLEERLGEGGMGVVFRAVREPEGDEVALKVLRAELSADETFRRRFVHEARAAGEVRHKHLVPITDAGEAEGRPYLAVAFVRGQTLEARLASDGPLPLEDMVRVVAHVASGLDALHAGGIVHRDVKPSNVMIDEAGSANLTDFGLAKGRAYTVLTKPGMVMGTLDYLAPEMLRGSEATGASDIYALGCLDVRMHRGPRAVRGQVDVRPRERAPERRAARPLREPPRRAGGSLVGDPAGAREGSREAAADGDGVRAPDLVRGRQPGPVPAGCRRPRPPVPPSPPSPVRLPSRQRAGAAARPSIACATTRACRRRAATRSSSPTRSASRRARSHSCSARPSASTADGMLGRPLEVREPLVGLVAPVEVERQLVEAFVRPDRRGTPPSHDRRVRTARAARSA